MYIVEYMIRIGNYYHKYEKIGEGAYSNVYKAYHNDLPQVFALKEINISVHRKNIDRFREEIFLMNKLEHPNILKLCDTIENDNYIYLILEYCDNGDLKHFLKKRPMKEKKVREFMKQIVSGLEYLNSHNIYHRDLKPQNILITKDLTLKISDFGLAKLCESDSLLDTICGSPMYMAPEIMKFKRYDTKADLWSLGVMFYQMMTGKTPFQARNHTELMENIEKNEIIFPRNIKISDDAQDLLLKLLKKSSLERMTWDELFSHNWIINEPVKNLFKTNIELQETTTIQNLDFDDEDAFFTMELNNDENDPGTGVNNFSDTQDFRKNNFNNYLEDTKFNPVKISIINNEEDDSDDDTDNSSLFLSDTYMEGKGGYVILSKPAENYAEYSEDQKKRDSRARSKSIGLIDSMCYYIYQSSNILKTYITGNSKDGENNEIIENEKKLNKK